MKVLVVGSGAREHALVWKCVQSDLVERVYCAPGNGGTGGMARNGPIGAADVVRLVDFAKRERLGLIVLGPEAAVDAGVGDALRHAGFNVFGPDRGAGRIESSKSFAKELMQRAEIPTAAFEGFTQPAPAKEWARRHDGRVAVKADGLARGKGVIVCAGVEESDAAVDWVMRPAVRALAESGNEFRGVLYAGLMLTPKGIRTLEFNARFGDPEAQVVLPRLESDFVALALAAAKGGLATHPDLRWNRQACVGVVVASAHYPDDVAMTFGHRIRGLTEMPRGVRIFHAGTRYEPGVALVTDGGRGVTSVGLGDTVAEARASALAGARQVRFEGAFFRSDIAEEAV